MVSKYLFDYFVLHSALCFIIIVCWYFVICASGFDQQCSYLNLMELTLKTQLVDKRIYTNFTVYSVLYCTVITLKSQ